ncbi:hypothetical protein GCM10019059_27810 [Camelimonas fluminis]|uniref:Crp/Fnr family transcriptional regulator n=1 Tax=Camelimonas fluminis TaxID=1576911 RepID=A0ABV7UDL2_9HYPH|nr:Crp/Fnr family transcriptional regulator [Camelimonas fluminis]GHE66451.1 hypothetical protein GCM10019059_27810 [Camelimonas fluminis]
MAVRSSKSEHPPQVAGGVRFGAMLVGDSSLRRSSAPYLLDGLTEEEVAEVLAAGRRLVVQRGARVFSQGALQDGIYLIETGRIKVFYTAPTGRQITLAYWHPGNFVGGPEIFRRGVHMWSGSAAANSAVIHLPGNALQRMVAAIPALAMRVMEGLIFKGKCYSALAQMLGTRSAQERLAYLLLHLADLYGVEEQGGTMIAATFTHADLAHMTGVTRQGVSTGIRQLGERGVIDIRDGRIVVLQPDALAALRAGSAVKTDP